MVVLFATDSLYSDIWKVGAARTGDILEGTEEEIGLIQARQEVLVGWFSQPFVQETTASELM